MSRTFTFADAQTLEDLQVFLARAARMEEGSVRLIAGSGVLAAYAAVLYPVGLLDENPTVLGLRTFALVPGADGEVSEFDVVVPIRSLLTRLERAQGERADDHGNVGTITITLPMEVNTVTWAAISPPRGGWHPTASTSADAAGRRRASRHRRGGHRTAGWRGRADRAQGAFRGLGATDPGPRARPGRAPASPRSASGSSATTRCASSRPDRGRASRRSAVTSW